MKERILILLSGLFFNNNTLNIYMSRTDYPDDMLSENDMVKNIVRICRKVHSRDAERVTVPIYMDSIASMYNLEADDIPNHELGKKYLLVYRKAKKYYEANKGEDFIETWRRELKCSIDAYIRRTRLEMSKIEHLMVKNSCFAAKTSCKEKDSCAVYKECKEATKHNRTMLTHIQLWREEQEEKIRNLTKSDGRVITASYGDPVSIEERIKRYTDMRDIKVCKGTIGIPFSLPTLNQWTDGWVKQRASCVVGRTAQGKTAFAIHELLYAYMNSNINVLHFNLEMPRDELLCRLDSALTSTSFTSINKGEFRDQVEFDEYVRSLREKLKERDNEFIILDTPNLSVAEFRYHIRQWYNRWGNHFIVCLDNLNIMKFIGRESKTELVDQAAQAFHEVMKEYDISGMLLAQLNREAEGQDSIRPSHFRDCDSIPDHMDWCVAILPYGVHKKKLTLVKGRNFMGSKIILENRLNCMQLVETGITADIDEDEKDFISADELEEDFV